VTNEREIVDAVRSGYAMTDADIGRVRSRLERSADAAGILDVAYRQVDSPIGPLLIAATTVGLVRIAFSSETVDEVLMELSGRISPRILEAPARLDRVATELDEYFAAARREFHLPLDRRLSVGFRRTVLESLPTIRYGATATYAAVARIAGSPNAVRAVGTACATNPIPIVVPCHRVVRSDGALGGYRGGVDAKRVLLTLERDLGD
jgi:methylated-DNA-[protein]-cysteine S-methyltransferase